MNREDFIEGMRRQYAEKIHEAYIESEHESGQVDYVQLKERLGKVMKAAKVEGLSQKEWVDLVESTLSAEVIKATGIGKTDLKAA